MPRCRVEDLPKDQRDKCFVVEHHKLSIVIGYDDWLSGEIVSMVTQVYRDAYYNVAQMIKRFSQAMKVYKDLLGNGKILFDDSSTWNHTKVVVRMDANGNILFQIGGRRKIKFMYLLSSLMLLSHFKKIGIYWYNIINEYKVE